MGAKKKNSTGKRYTEAQKKAALAFLAKQGRGGVSATQKKYGISYTALRQWIDGAGVKRANKSPKDNAPSTASIKAVVKEVMGPEIATIRALKKAFAKL